VEAGVPQPAAMKRLDGLAYLLDNSIPIPGTGRRVGLDAVIGLIPGVGDAAGSVLSAYIVVEAARAGTPFPVLARMVMNVAVEGIVGSIPFLGDLFDAAFKANDRNVRLLRAAMAEPDAARRSSKGVIVGVVLLLLLVLGVAGFLSYLALRALARAL